MSRRKNIDEYEKLVKNMIHEITKDKGINGTLPHMQTEDNLISRELLPHLLMKHYR